MKHFWQKQAFLWFIGLLIAVPIVILTLDMPVSLWCMTHKDWGRPWHELRRLIMLSEIFGHGWGAVFVGLAVYVLDPARRRGFYRLVLVVLATGLAPDLIKLILARYRPHFFFSGTFPGVADNVWQTFGGIQTAFSSDYQSFPSGHSALACGLAVILVQLYPRGKFFFSMLATLVMVQRVVACAHFPSDTLAGAALGIFVATLCLPGGHEDDPSLEDHSLQSK